MFILPQDTKDRRRPAPSTPKPTRPQSISKKNKKGETVVKTKTAEGRRKLVLKDNKEVSTVKKGKKILSREVNHRNADGSHKKTVTKKADGSKSVRKYKKGKTFMDTKTITKTTDKAGNKSRTVSNFGKKNKKGETTSTTRTKTSKGVTTKRDVYTKNKKGKAIVKTKTRGPNGKVTTSRRKQEMNSLYTGQNNIL